MVSPSRATCLALGVTAALAAGLGLRDRILLLPPAWLGLLATLAVLGTLTVIAVLTPRRLLSAGFLYVLMLSLFHLSIPFVRTLGATVPATFAAYIDTWYDSSDVAEAIYLSVIAVLALTAAFAWVHARRGGPEAAPVPVPVAPPGFALAGAALVGAGTLAYLGDLAVLAPQLLEGGSYTDYLDTVGGTRTIAGATLLIAIGLCVAAAGGRCRARTVAWVVFGVFAAIVLSFGGRTAAMFPAVAGVVAAAAASTRIPRMRTAAVAIVLGVLSITAVQQVRGTGLAATSLDQIDLNPVGALAETGGTVRTVAEVVMWRRTYQEPPYHGTTYVASLNRGWERLMGEERPDGSADSRYAGVLLHQRFPDFQLGFSPVAEAFLNFGTLGVVAIFAAFGLLLGVFDARRLSPLGAARLGVIMYALAYTVRNASNTLPVTILAGFAIIWCASRFLNRRRGGVRGYGRRESPPPPRAPIRRPTPAR